MKHLVLLTLLVLMTQCLSAEDIPQEVQENKPGLFRVNTYKNNSLQSTTTGFFIDSIGTFLTTKHAVSNGSIWTVTNLDGTTYPVFEISAAGTRNDLAVLKVDWPEGKPYPYFRLPKQPPVDNDEVFAYGFDSAGSLIDYAGVVTSVKMSQQVGQILLCTIPVFDELDGCPLFDHNGRILGIFSTLLADKFELNLAISFASFYNTAPLKKEQAPPLDTAAFYAENMNEYGEHFAELYKSELQLQPLCDSMIDGWNMFVRLDALTDFIPQFRKTLQIEGSYNYPFDSLKAIKILSPPDNKFRIFNWTLKFDNESAGLDRVLFRYYGAIQFRNRDSIELVPLFDGKRFIERGMEEDTILSNEGWYGVQYFDAGIFRSKGKTYYILLGWDGNDFISDKKVIEPLWFDEEGMPRFGAPIFRIGDEFKTRIILQYNDASVVTIDLKQKEKAIVFDHLVPQNPKYKDKQWTYVPDGSYDYFKFKRKYLVYKEGFYSGARKPDKYAEH